MRQRHRPTDIRPITSSRSARPGLRITLAVAGFTMDDLQITQEDNQLVIRGRQTDDSQGRIFLHRGIAARQFQRSFVLAEGIEVKGAWLDNGLLAYRPGQAATRGTGEDYSDHSEFGR